MTQNTVLFVSAENGALEGGKVGGIADVVRDLPVAMSGRNWRVVVVTPSYGVLDHAPGFSRRGTVSTRFRERVETATIFGGEFDNGVQNLVIEHPLLSGSERGRIYYDDGPNEPFATDGTRFALFSAFVAAWLCERDDINVIHLHDWHAAMVALLRTFSPHFAALLDKRVVFTIHNLALQGIRPLRGHPSSLFEWFPDLVVDERVIDPRWPDCVNLMRGAILLSDQVNTVSPSYAREILTADDENANRHGGEGLEKDLQTIEAAGNLVGILNGCDYARPVPGRRRTLPALLGEAKQHLRHVAGQERFMRTAHWLALDRIETLRKRQRGVLVTSVGRLGEQKLGLLRRIYKGKPVLVHLLEVMGNDGVLTILGSGDKAMEAFLTETAAGHENFVFFAGYFESFANDLYRSGKLFLMPSTFEPCGISQMLAMRAGQPCVVHGVGGLIDTVRHGETGWVFGGETGEQQCAELIATFREAFAEAKRPSPRYKAIAAAAAAARFTWDDAALRYETLYTS